MGRWQDRDGGSRGDSLSVARGEPQRACLPMVSKSHTSEVPCTVGPPFLGTHRVKAAVKVTVDHAVGAVLAHVFSHLELDVSHPVIAANKLEAALVWALDGLRQTLDTLQQLQETLTGQACTGTTSLHPCSSKRAWGEVEEGTVVVRLQAGGTECSRAHLVFRDVLLGVATSAAQRARNNPPRTLHCASHAVPRITRTQKQTPR